VPAFSNDAGGLYSGTARVATSVTGGQIKVKVNGVGEVSKSYTFERIGASLIDTILRTERVYSDAPTIELSVQIRDSERFHTRTTGKVRVDVRSPIFDGGKFRFEIDCTPDNKGICHISVPLSVDNLFAKLATDVVLVVWVGIVADGAPAPALAGQVTAYKGTSISTKTKSDTLVAEVPSRDLYAGDEFDVEIVSHLECTSRLPRCE